MSGFETVAAAIGITDIAIKSIKALFHTVQDFNNAPEDIQQVKTEVINLQKGIGHLEFLNEAREGLKKQCREIGLAQNINVCGEACSKFRVKLDEWTRHDQGKSRRDRWNILINKAEIQNFINQIRNAVRLVQVAVEILTLQTVVGIDTLVEKMESCKIAAQDDLGALEQQMKAIQDLLQDERTELRSFLNKLDTATQRTDAIKAEVEIGTVTTAEDARARVGVSEVAVSQVGRVTIGNVDTSSRGKAMVGIMKFPEMDVS